MSKQIFAIVGYTNWGKSNTLYELFNKKLFLPLLSPITSDKLADLRFTVINASNEDRTTKAYLERLKAVIKKHKATNTTFVITISLIFNDGSHDVKEVFRFLNSLEGFHIDYLILENGWYKGDVLLIEDLKLMKDHVSLADIHHFSGPINESKGAFSKRTKQIAETIKRLKKI
jgi:GTP1/Obg family GTP-binding protein